MPKYIVERTYAFGAPLPGDGAVDAFENHLVRNGDLGVTWVHSYVTEDKAKSFCVIDAPSPEAIRRAAKRNSLPVDQITQVRVLDPYPCR
jgi:hypothetical protein